MSDSEEESARQKFFVVPKGGRRSQNYSLRWTYAFVPFKILNICKVIAKFTF